MIIRPYPGFIIPTRRFVDVGMPRSGVSMKGRYQIRVLDAYGIEKRRTPWFDNIILDSGLNRWGTGLIISGAAIGTGASAPASTDTGLQTQTHWTTASGTGGSSTAGISPNYNNTTTWVYRTTLGALNGNYSEVGVGWATGSNMFSRALILDGGGTPTTLSVSSSEQLDIAYQLSIYPPLVDTGPTTITISGVDYDVTGRACAVGTANQTFGGPGWPVSTGSWAMTSSNMAYSGNLGVITSSPSGTSMSLGTLTTSAYSDNSLSRSGYTTSGLNDANVGGIMSVYVNWTSASFQYKFDPVIPKDNTKSLVLNYSVTWARR